MRLKAVNKWVGCALIAGIVTIFASTTVIALAKRSPAPNVLDAVTLPDRLLPGHTLPKEAKCDWNPAAEEMLYCQVLLDENSIYISYDMRRNLIVNAALSAHDTSIGDLITVWGNPTGMIRWNLSVQVFWGSRSAYVVTRQFTPSSRASYISYTADLHPTDPWKGFINHLLE
jgi:hypothetical protein